MSDEREPLRLFVKELIEPSFVKVVAELLLFVKVVIPPLLSILFKVPLLVKLVMFFPALLVNFPVILPVL